MTDFSNLSDNQSMPSSGSTVEDNALGLSNPDSMLAGQLRGTQNVGSGGAQIDSANNRITVTSAADGSVIGLGNIPGSTTNEFGFFSEDNKGNMIFKIVGGTMFVYDPSNNYTNIVQTGLLPDGSGGITSADPGTNVSDLYIT